MHTDCSVVTQNASLWLLGLAKSRPLRCLCLAIAITAITQFFWLGSKPIAVNLIPPPWDKLAHFATFFSIAMLFWFGFALRGRFAIVLAGALLSITDEIHQLWLPGRSADWQDLAADAAALAAFWLVAYLWARFVSEATIVPSSARSD